MSDIGPQTIAPGTNKHSNFILISNAPQLLRPFALCLFGIAIINSHLVFILIRVLIDPGGKLKIERERRGSKQSDVDELKRTKEFGEGQFEEFQVLYTRKISVINHLMNPYESKVIAVVIANNRCTDRADSSTPYMWSILTNSLRANIRLSSKD
jgi:hypothetical protein